MTTPRITPSRLRLCLLALAVSATLALPACSPARPPQSAAAAQDSDDCGSADGCDSPLAMSSQVRLDTEAMLAGMAHARARLGLQEDATP